MFEQSENSVSVIVILYLFFGPESFYKVNIASPPETD